MGAPCALLVRVGRAGCEAHAWMGRLAVWQVGRVACPPEFVLVTHLCGGRWGAVPLGVSMWRHTRFVAEVHTDAVMVGGSGYSVVVCGVVMCGV